MIYQVQKRKKKKNGVSKEDTYYSLRYRFGDMPGDKWISLKTSDKQVAEKKAQDFYQQKQQEEAGLIPSQAARNAGTTPLPHHLEDYLADLTARGKTPKHIEVCRARITKLFNDCNWKLMGDVQSDDFIQWRNTNAGQLSATTLNHYLDAAITLFNWMVKDGRTSLNPLQHVKKADGRGKLKRERRAFTEDEMQRLLDTAGKNRLAYFLAVSTGLRRNELEQLTWGDVHLEGPAPYILARAGTTKNRKEEQVSLSPEITGELAECQPTTPLPSSLVLPHGIPRMRELKKDLKKAKIVYCDDKGRYADFHALRHTCATHMLKNGMSAILVKKHMRHSDLKLTTNCYTDQDQLDVSNALPSHQAPSAQICAQILGPEGQNVAQPDATGCGSEKQKPLKTGAQVASWLEETQNKMVEAVGVEPTSQTA